MAYTDIDKSSEYFDTILYTGDGASSRTITGLNFSTDLIWYKRRNAVGHNRLIDTVRGIDKILASDLTNAESTEATYVTAINSDGWSIGNNTDVNNSGTTMAVWNWRGSDSSAVSNTDGTISSTVSASTTSGFSIVSWTGNGTSGATIGHGLGAVPKMIIVKQRSQVNGWGVYHHTLGTGSELYLNMTQATTSSNFWITTPTTSVFSVSGSDYVNESGQTYIAYCFAEKKGFSKFGSYTGNGSTDGTFVYTGMRPAFVIQKRTDATAIWRLFDNKRLGYNVDNNAVSPNGTSAEGTGDFIDLLSNGFKLRSTDADVNASGGTYIYMAFAEHPFVTSTSIPTTAR